MVNKSRNSSCLVCLSLDHWLLVQQSQDHIVPTTFLHVMTNLYKPNGLRKRKGTGMLPRSTILDHNTLQNRYAPHACTYQRCHSSGQGASMFVVVLRPHVGRDSPYLSPSVSRLADFSLPIRGSTKRKLKSPPTCLCRCWVTVSELKSREEVTQIINQSLEPTSFVDLRLL